VGLSIARRLGGNGRRPGDRPARKLLVANPAFTIRQYLAIPGFQDMPEYHARLAQGLREAGVPET
jgi:hypothetical protein